jgi:hypothetical protein
MDLGAGLLAILTAVVVKGVVMLLAAVLVARVFRATHAPAPRRLWLLVPPEARREARVLSWALVCFAASELTCGVEIYVLTRSSAWVDGVHGILSAAGMALFALGAYRVLDRQVVRFATPECAARRMCGACTVRTPEGCKLRVALSLGASFVVLAALFALLAPTTRMDADLHRFALPFPALNAWYDRVVVPWLSAHVRDYEPTGQAYFFPASVFVLELRVVPLAVAALASYAVASLAAGRLARGVDALLIAAGALGYVYFEIVLYRGTGDLLLGSLGHEVGELWFLLFAAELLRRAYPVDRRV